MTRFVFFLILILSVAQGIAQDLFDKGEVLVTVSNQDMIEISGLAASHNFPGHLWGHNDSGNQPILFLFNAETGEIRSELFLKGIRNRDWEDMAIGPGPDGTPHLFIAEIGDNRRVYDSKGIYYFPEPEKLAERDTLTEFRVFTFNFPDENRDAETLMVDPATGSLWLTSKWEPRVRLYKIDYNSTIDSYGEVKEIGKLGLTMVTGGAISPDGNEVLLKNYESVFYFRKPDGMTWEEGFLDGSFQTLPYKQEKQGEAICWKHDGSGYYTMSEGQPVLIFYPRL